MAKSQNETQSEIAGLRQENMRLHGQLNDAADALTTANKKLAEVKQLLHKAELDNANLWGYLTRVAQMVNIPLPMQPPAVQAPKPWFD